MKIAIVDVLGLTYDGTSLEKKGLGGSESAVIYISRELAKLGHEVFVINDCEGSDSAPGLYDKVTYIGHNQILRGYELPKVDVAISSRSVSPFMANSIYSPFMMGAKHRVLWMHDTFCEGDQYLEDMLVKGFITEVFTLSDFHSWYVTSADHGNKRNFEVLKHKFWQTRNGAFRHIPLGEIELKNKKPLQFVYNASATKGLIPLLEKVWPRLWGHLNKEAELICIGGYYQFKNRKPDAQELTVREFMKDPRLEQMNVRFTGVITQKEIAKILAESTLMLYPTAFPETFGISSLESLLYRTPIVTNVFGALEETAIDRACYKIPYSSTNNALFNNIDEERQANIFVETVLQALNNPYLLQQKQYSCDIIDDIAGWDTVAKQWEQHLYSILGKPLPVEKFREVDRINRKVARVFRRRFNNPEDRNKFHSGQKQQKIVVISPFYNAAEYLERHIESVAQQDYDKWEHYLIDDASTDNSYQVAYDTIKRLGMENKIHLFSNEENRGAIYNQLSVIQNLSPSNIVMLLDGDDWLINNNTIFHYYNDLYWSTKTEFTYGSCWSVVDNIPLIAQDYPDHIKNAKAFRDHKFNWGIPYTHLRTFRAHLAIDLDHDTFKTEDGDYMRAGADSPLFYELIERAYNPIAVKDVLCNYNDANPLNDFRVRPEEQNRNAGKVKKNKPMEDSKVKTILIAIPTNKYVETETMKSIYDLIIPNGFKTDLQFFYGYRIDQIRNLIADWGKRYDYVFHVDSDIVLPRDSLIKLIEADKPIVSGLYIQRKPGEHILEVYSSVGNIPYKELENKGLTKVYAVGFGCCLVKSTVYRKTDYPHFLYKPALNHSETVSEDWYFCDKAFKAGFDTWVDTSLQCEHIGQTKFNVGVIQTPVPESSKRLTHLQEVAIRDLLPKDHANYLSQMKSEFGFEPKVIYDIGACVLHWTREAKKVWPNSEYILFDAAQSVEPFLRNSGHSYWLGVLTNEDDKRIEFYEDPENPGGNSYYKETTGAYTSEHKSVRTGWTLDTVIKANKWPWPDLIKMDIQGAEVDVMKGAPECMKRASHIILEAQHENYNEGAPRVNDVITWMDAHGFDLVSNFCQGGVDGDYHFIKRKKS